MDSKEILKEYINKIAFARRNFNQIRDSLSLYQKLMNGIENFQEPRGYSRFDKENLNLYHSDLMKLKKGVKNALKFLWKNIDALADEPDFEHIFKSYEDLDNRLKIL